MGQIVNDQFISSYYGDQIDALLAAMAQANPLPSGTNWVAFIDDLRDLLAQAQAAQTAAETAQTGAGSSATLSQSWAIGGTGTRLGEDTNNSRFYSQRSGAYAANAQASQNAASASERVAANSASTARNSADAAVVYKNQAAASAAAAQNAAATAAADAASQAAEQAAEQTAAELRSELQVIADSASDSADLSESWAVGGTGTRVGEDTDNSKYYAERAQAAAEQASVPPVEGVYNVIVADRVTGARYALVVYGGRITLVGVAATTEATNMTLIDAASGVNYTLAVTGGRLELVEV